MDDELTFARYLDEWLTLQRTRVEPTTWRSYADMIRYYVRPHVDDLLLSEVSVRRLDLLYVELLNAGGRGGRSLSRRTVRYVHGIVHKALADAVASGLLAENVSDRATVPRVHPTRDAAPRRVVVWDAEQASRFLELSAHHEHADLWRVALGTGMRRGELLGLRWQDVDLTVPQLRVETALAYVEGRPRLKGTKTGRSRVLVLDRQTAAAIDRRPRRDGPWPLVFTTDQGAPLRPEAITDAWRGQWPALDPHLPRIRLHDTRHCHATLLLSKGVPLKVVSERLGHSTIAMTMDVYAHVLPAMDHDAATAIGAALDGPR
jgi:integrase